MVISIWQGHIAVLAHPCLSPTELLRGTVGNNCRLAQEWFGTEPGAKQRPAGKWGVWYLTLVFHGPCRRGREWSGLHGLVGSMVWWSLELLVPMALTGAVWAVLFSKVLQNAQAHW